MTQINCPCHSLPGDWIIAPRVVLTQREGAAAEGSNWGGPEHSPSAQLAPAALGWPEAHTAFVLHLHYPAQRQIFLGILLDLCSPWWPWPFCPLQQMLTPWQKVCAMRSLLLLSPYPYALLCWERVHASMGSFLLVLLLAPRLLISLQSLLPCHWLA